MPCQILSCLQIALSVCVIDRTQVIGLEQVGGPQRHAAVVLGIEKGEGKVAAVHLDHRQTKLFDDLRCNRLLLLQRLNPFTDMSCGQPRIDEHLARWQCTRRAVIQQRQRRDALLTIDDEPSRLVHIAMQQYRANLVRQGFVRLACELCEITGQLQQLVRAPHEAALITVQCLWPTYL